MLPSFLCAHVIIVFAKMAAVHQSLIPGNRGGKVVVVQNFRFYQHEKIHWHCWRQNCRAKVYTNVLNKEDEGPVIRVIGFLEEDQTQPQNEDMISRAELPDVGRDDPLVAVRWVYKAEFVCHCQAVWGGGDRPLAERGDAPPRWRRKWRILEATLVWLRGQYNDGNRNFESYWDSVSHCVVEAV